MDIKQIKIKKKKRQIKFENPVFLEQMRRRRFNVVIVFCVFSFIVISFRAVQLHISRDDKLNWIANKQYRAVVPQAPIRGRILDSSGRELAVSVPVHSAYTDPNKVQNPMELVRSLSTVLEFDSDKLLERLKNKKKNFAWIKRRITPKEETVLRELKIPNVYFVEEGKRFYPNGILASNLLGAVGMDSDALGGIELAYDNYLRYEQPELKFSRDAKGRLYSTTPPSELDANIANLTLTIDKNIQFIAEDALRRAVSENKAKDGVIVVMDPSSGRVLAMANYPTFDPNEYSNYSPALWRDRAVTDTFEPGSTFKVLVVSAALDAGVVNPEKKFDCGMGSIRVGNAILHDHNPYGMLTVEDIIKVSSNIGALKIARTLGKEELYSTLRKFGIGKKLGIDLPGESNGNLRPVETWQPVEYATISFGQGLAVTPLQMCAAMASVANKGHLMRPYIVKKIEDGKGNLLYSADPKELSRPISENTAEVMTQMLMRVVKPGGTGTRAASDEYIFAGKTGTAQKVERGRRSYAGGKYFSSFFGFAPADEPRVVIFVGIDEPQGAYYGGVVAAPVFKEVAEKTLHYLGVPSAASPIVYTATAEPVPESVAVVVDEGREPPRFVSSGDGRYAVPDVSGLTMRQVLDLLDDTSVAVGFKGSGIAVEQDPLPGSEIKEGTLFSVRFKQP